MTTSIENIIFQNLVLKKREDAVFKWFLFFIIFKINAYISYLE